MGFTIALLHMPTFKALKVLNHSICSRAVMIPNFLEPIPEPEPQTKRAITGADSNLESVPVVESAPILESAPLVEPAPKNSLQIFRFDNHYTV